MLIRNKTVFVYDVEVFPNLFTCAIKNTESENVRIYEISEIKNNLELIRQLFLNKRIFFAGYNNLFYDDIIINWLIINYNNLIVQPYWDITKGIKQLNDKIIGSQKDRFNGLEQYKHANLFESLDLLAMMYSNKLRIGLKELQVTMQYPNVLQYDGDFNKPVSINQIQEVKYYNNNDIQSTAELLKRCQKDIELRVSIENEYHIRALNKDGVNLGMEILKQKYLEETHLFWKDIKDLRSPCDKINLNEIIFDFIEFQTKDLQDILQKLKSTVIYRREKEGKLVWDEIEYKFYLGGSIQVISSGGIHSQVQPEAIEPASDEILVDWDVNSMYPSIIIQHNCYPRHLGKEFLNIYSKIYTERLKAKKEGNKLVNETYKLSLNGLSGNLQSEYSWCYDPMCVYRIRINGQLMLLMLAEQLSLIGAKIIQLNTDGAMVLLKKDTYEQSLKIKEDWEKKTKLTLAPEYFERFYQFAINDYVGVMQGWSETHDPKYIKRKGMFLENITLGKGMAPMIIAHAVNKELVEGIPCEETIRNCQDIKKFLTYQKVSKDFDVEYNGEIVQHINRYYMSYNGHRLYKVQFNKSTGEELRRISMCSSGVTLLNKFEDEPVSIKDRAINYHYYINEAKKILLPIKTVQYTLF